VTKRLLTQSCYFDMSKFGSIVCSPPRYSFVGIAQVSQARFRSFDVTSTLQDTTSNRSYFLSTNSGRTARAFAIALSLAVDSSAANMVRTCSSPVADRRSFTENAVLRLICGSFIKRWQASTSLGRPRYFASAARKRPYAASCRGAHAANRVSSPEPLGGRTTPRDIVPP
jgi:hypothetical protein